MKLKPGASRTVLVAELGEAVTDAGWDEAILNGFAGVFNATQLRVIRTNPNVASLEEDGIVTVVTAAYTVPSDTKSVTLRHTLCIVALQLAPISGMMML